ncbi:uncharacterized protein LOC144434136 [Glandiceps talaboti]
MSDISDSEARDLASVYMTDLRASMWKSVKADRERLLQDLEEHDSSYPGQNGDHGSVDFDLDTLRSRSAILRQEHLEGNQKSSQHPNGGSTYRVEKTEVLNNSRVRTSSHSSAGSANDYKQVNTSIEQSMGPKVGVDVIGIRNKVQQNGKVNGVFTSSKSNSSGNNTLLTVPDSGLSTDDTPRTTQLKDLRSKRLAYYDKKSPPTTTTEPVRQQGKKTPRKKTPRKEVPSRDIKNDIPIQGNGNIQAELIRANNKNVDPPQKILSGATHASRESATIGNNVKRDGFEQVSDVTHLYGERVQLQRESLSTPNFSVQGTKSNENTGDTAFEYCVEPVIDLKGLQEALKEGDEGLRKYLQEMGRLQQTNIPKEEGKHKIVNKFPTSPGVEMNFERQLNHLENSSVGLSVSPRERNRVSPRVGKKRDDSFIPKKQNIWEERTLRERPGETSVKNVVKDKKNKLAENKSKVGSPKVSSKELETLGLYDDLFRESKEERLNNEMTNLKTSLMKRDPPLTRNYDTTANAQETFFLTDVSRSGTERQLPDIPQRNHKPTNLGLDFNETSSDSDAVDRTDHGIHHVRNEWNFHKETVGDQSQSDLELETHRPDIRPISPLKQIKSNIPTPKSNQSSDKDEGEGKKMNVFNNGIGITPRLQTPKKPEGVPNLNLEPSSSSEESDHIEFLDFKEEKKPKKSGHKQLVGQTNSLGVPGYSKNKLSRPKERVMKSEFTLRLSMDSNASGASELVESEIFPLQKSTNLTTKFGHGIGKQSKEARNPSFYDVQSSKKVTKSVFSPKTVLEDLDLSTHRSSPTEGGSHSKSTERVKQQKLSSHDLMNEMYDDWIQTHANPMTHNVFLKQMPPNPTSESPRTDFFQDSSDHKPKRQPTGRSGVSVSDFLTGIDLQHSEGKMESATPEMRETQVMRPFDRGETILKANSKGLQSGRDVDKRKRNAETYKVLEKSFSDVEKKLAELGLEHLLDESKSPEFSKAADSRVQMIKMCPQCDAINREHITWCLECGCVLIGVQSEPHPDVVRAIASNYATEKEKPKNEDIPEDKPSPQDSLPSPPNVQKDMKSSDPKLLKANDMHAMSIEVDRKDPDHTVQKVFIDNSSPDPDESSKSVKENDLTQEEKQVVERQLTAYEQYLLHLERQRQLEGTQPDKPSLGKGNPKQGREIFDDISDGSQGTSQDTPGVESESPPEHENDVSVVEDSSDVPDDAPHPLFEIFLKDPRVKPGVLLAPVTTSQPRPSSAGPQRSVSEKTQTRPSSSGSKSKTRQYVEEGPYQRHWSRSSTAWDTYNKNELSTWASVDTCTTRKLSPQPRPLSAKKSVGTATSSNTARNKTKTKSANRQSTNYSSSNNNNNDNDTQRQRPKSASTRHKNEGDFGTDGPQRSKSATGQRGGRSQEDKFFQVNPAQLSDSTTRPLNSHGPSSVPPLTLKLLLESPREGRSLSIWQLLPDEILLKIFAFLNHRDLARCALVCHLFDRIARDDSLWRHISLEKKTLHDEWLEEIGKKCPTTLSLVQCRGARITSSGLRSLFRACSSSLEELNISGCSQGELVGDSILLHATRCPELAVIDASWCNVTDNAVVAIADSSNRLEAVCLNGCQALTDEALYAMVNKHANR